MTTLYACSYIRMPLFKFFRKKKTNRTRVWFNVILFQSFQMLAISEIKEAIGYRRTNMVKVWINKDTTGGHESITKN